MWIVYAFGAAFFGGVTSVLAKCGIRRTDSNVATAVRTVIVLLFSWLMVFLTGSQKTIAAVDAKSWTFLILSGLATGASWLCYFKALQLGNINQVVPVDKSSTILTMLLAFFILGEPITLLKMIAIVCIGCGTCLMLERKKTAEALPQSGKKGWFVYAALSAFFAALTAILGKIGITGVESNLGTAIRTGVVLLMAWIVVFASGKRHCVRRIEKKEFGFICLSGVATGASWLCYYKALQEGAASVVAPIDKLSILVTVAFSYFVFHEKLSKKSAAGLFLIVAGTLLLLI